MSHKFLLLLLLFVNCLAQNPEWVDEQIQEDLEYLSSHPVYSSDLGNWFDKMSENGQQAIYFRIRNGKITWKKTQKSDEWRNHHIFSFISDLNDRNSLPDTDFILLTEDGVSKGSKMPIFAFAKRISAKNVVLFPDFEMLWEVQDSTKNWINHSIKWSKKYFWDAKKNCAFFRGASTGRFDPTLSDFGNDRVRAVIFSQNNPQLLNAAFHVVYQQEIKDLLASINSPIIGAHIHDHYKYKYLLDIDGNSCTYSRCRWILLSNSVLIKVISQNNQWYYKALKPWVHFIPIKQDFSDLKKSLNLLIHFDGLARKIAVQGQDLGKALFSKEMVEFYIVHLLHEYAQHVNINS